MYDWKSEVRLRLRDVQIDPTRHAQIVEELSGHLADRHRALLARGTSPWWHAAEEFPRVWTFSAKPLRGLYAERGCVPIS